jgi:hypothetical protein
MAKSNPTTRAQSGGSVKPMPKDNGGSGSSNNGLKTAWKDQTKSPSAMNNMAKARERVK